MKFTLPIYVSQPKKGLYAASIPWVAPLAGLRTGPSPALLKEELMFALLDLVHGGLRPADLDRLIPPSHPYLSSMYIDASHKVDPDRPAVSMSTSTHIIVGSWPDEDLRRIWLPAVPGTCIVVDKPDHLYATVTEWVGRFAERNRLENLDSLRCSYTASIETVEVDLGFPSYDADGAVASPGGRLLRPETLQEVASNLSHRADDGTLPRAFGRTDLVGMLVEALMSRTPQNICLVGPSGVGKTALVHEAAWQAFEVADAYLERKDIWQTSGDRIIAGMSIIGQWEQRTEAMCRELAERKDVVFVEDLLGLVRAGRTFKGDSNVARFIEPYVEEDRFAIVTEATEESWAIARAKAPGFVDNFRRIPVPELGYRETLGVLTDLIRDIEGAAKVRFTPDGVEAILHLTRRFARQEAFPGKAVRLVKQCQHEAMRMLNDDPSRAEVRVDPDLVAHVIHRHTGLPMTILRPGSGRTPEEVGEAFGARVFGQPQAIEVVTSLVLAIEQGLSDPRRPLASLLLVGPSGVGKTETAKALATDLFGSEDRMVRFDMSEFSESTAISRLIGSPNQPDGELTSKVRLQPFCVVLFDEIEKAHPLVLDLLLQLLGDGRLTDAAGRRVDFRNAIVVMTSNLGAHSEDRWLGFRDEEPRERDLHYRRAAESFFRPELFNRIDRVIPYRPLGPDALRLIARRTLTNLLERRGLQQAQVMVDVDESLIDFLAKNSVDSRYGARTLAHRIEQLLMNPLAHRLTTHRPGDGLTRVTMSPTDGGVGIELETIERAPQTQRWEGPTSAPTQEALLTQLSGLVRRASALTDADRRKRIEARYQELLSEFNEIGAAGGDASALADELRTREGFLNRLAHVERRLIGLQDPHGTGEFVFSATPEERKAKLHWWSGVAGQIAGQLTWLEVQSEALAAEEPRGGALVMVGLAGPYHRLLARWERWLAGLGGVLDLECVFSYRTRDGWVGDISRPRRADAITAFAVSSAVPGTGTLFEALAGLTWNPVPPSHGQPALVAARAEQFSTGSAAELLAWVRDHRRAETNALIEFEESDGVFTDVRSGRSWTIPEDRSSNLGDFMASVLVHRLSPEAHDG